MHHALQRLSPGFSLLAGRSAEGSWSTMAASSSMTDAAWPADPSTGNAADIGDACSLVGSESAMDWADSATDTMEAVDLERALRGDGAANEVKVSMRTRLGARRGRGR